MNQYELLKKRSSYNSLNNLKERSFNRVLDNFYNTETIYKIEDMNNPIKAIIQYSRLGDKVDYKKISANFSSNLKVGDIIYWDREKNNWLIYLERTTEKDYFLGEIKIANYEIRWIDKNGKEYSQLGNFTRGSGDLKNVSFLDYLEETSTLILPKNEKTINLKRYNRFVIDKDTWEVKYIDTTTYSNMIIYILGLSQKNKDLDTEDLPYGKINDASKILSNLDNITSIKLGTSFIIINHTIINGQSVQDNYSINTKNCELSQENIITFNELGSASIEIISETTGKKNIYNIEVVEESINSKNYIIIGNDKVKATLSYDYKISIDINGNISYENGYWEIDTDSEDTYILEQDMEKCKIKIGKNPGVFNLYYLIDEEIKVQKKIEIINLFDF